MTSLSKTPRFGAMFVALGASGSLLAKLRQSGLPVQSASTLLAGRPVNIYATGGDDVLTLTNTGGEQERLSALAEKLAPSGNPKGPLPTAEDVYNKLVAHPVPPSMLERSGRLDLSTTRDKGYYYKLFPWADGRKA